MRQIRLRAFVKKEHKLYNVEAIDFIGEVVVLEGEEKYCYTFDEVILEQFTGLLDKGKKDSYAGDKIRTANWGDVVIEWNGHAACFGFYYKSKFGKSWVPLYKVVEFEIIGNIHEEAK